MTIHEPVQIMASSKAYDSTQSGTISGEASVGWKSPRHTFGNLPEIQVIEIDPKLDQKTVFPNKMYNKTIGLSVIYEYYLVKS